MNDPLLKALNLVVNEYDITFGVTLAVSGGVIAGTLISAKTFVADFSDSFSNAWPGGANEHVRSGFAVWGEPGSEKIHEEFIHLRDARYVFGAELTPSGLDGILWRGKLDSVTGFSLGAFTKN
ncbi:hypothetical protein [Pseudomonas sp. EA_65y_Pfl1_P120]|uniref:hypothetical protein n=1 Tax=Pseudomonas sp. EA_65y_Pfl1_P120 TaxID=3088693 RepID=UPI0030D88E1E